MNQIDFAPIVRSPMYVSWSKVLSRSLLLLSGLLTWATIGSAQDPLETLWGTGDRIDAAAIVNDTLYVGGTFNYVGPPTGQLAFIDRATGQADLTWPKIGGTVYAIEPDGMGGFFIGGDFYWAGGSEQHNLVHILPNGTVNETCSPEPFSDQFQVHGQVRTLLVKYGVLYVGGLFDRLDDDSRFNLAALDATTCELLPKSVHLTGLVPGGTGPMVLDMTIVEDVLYVAGTFTHADEFQRHGVVALSVDDWEVLPWNAHLDRGVQALAAKDPYLYLTGNFDHVGGESRRRYASVALAKADGHGGNVTSWNPGSSSNTSLLRTAARILVVENDYIYAVGTLGSISNPNGFVKIDPNSGASVLFGQGANIDAGTSMSIHGSTAYLAGNAFSPIGVGRSVVIMEVDITTQEIGDLSVLGGAPGLTRLINDVHLTDSHLVVGGDFSSLGGIPRRYLAGFDLTTGEPTAFDPQPFSSVRYMTASPDGRFLYWETPNGIGVTDLRTNESWTYWPPNRDHYDPLLRKDSVEDDGGVRNEGPLFVDGDRPYVPPVEVGAPPRDEVPRVRGGQRRMIATEDRLFFAGAALERLTAEVVWATPVSIFLGVDFGESILFGEGGPGATGDTLIISGDIFAAGDPSVTRHDLVAFDAETGEVLDWYPGPTYNTAGIFGITLAGNTLYVGGKQLWEIGGHSRNNAAAIDVHTAEILPWAPNVRGGTGVNPEIWTLDHHEGVIYAGGYFHQVNGQFRLRAAAIDAETGDVLDWNAHFQHYWVDPFPGVRTIIVSPEHERVFLTGSFLNSAKGSGHANVVGLSLVGADPPVGTEPGALPERASLSAPFPNPARNSATVTLSLPQSASVEVAVYDVLGRRVAVVHAGALEAGEQALTLDASRLAAGVYVVRAAGEGFSESKRITIVR